MADRAHLPDELALVLEVVEPPGTVLAVPRAEEWAREGLDGPKLID